MMHPLDSFFSPQSIAIIGASREPHKIPGLLLSFLRKNEFPGALYPVNPNYADINGLRCYPDIASIGAPIDLAIVVIPARHVLGALEQCAAVGVKNAIIISSGFAEEGGDAAHMQDDIAALAKRTGMRVSGPNAEGFYNEPGKVAATFSPTVDVKPDAPRLMASRRRIGIVAQSGGIGFAIYNRARALGIALSCVISTGNESDLGAGEFFDYMVQDANTDVILLFIEGIRDTEMFLKAAQRAADIGKPVIVVKVARSGAGERAAASHTASMAGSSAEYDAVFAKYGFIVSDDLDEAVAIAAVLTTSPLPQGARVAVVTVSGGAGIWGADAVSMLGMQVPELSDNLQQDIRALIPSYGSPRNPVDITAQAVHSGGLQKTMELLEASDEVDAVLVIVSMASETRMPFKMDELKPLMDRQTKPILLWSYTLPSHFARTGLAASGVIILTNLSHAATALKQLATHARSAPEQLPLRAAGVDLANHITTAALSEHDSKALLRAGGIAVPDEVLVATRDAFDAALIKIGFPLVLKIQSPDIAHKSEVGGVEVGIADRAQAVAAYDRLLARVKRHRPAAALQGVLVAAMAKKGVEIILGTLIGSTFGPMLMVGLGGITTELFKDVVYRPAPVSEMEALAMLDDLKASPLLKGFRGARPCDMAALSDLMVKLSVLAASNAHCIAEFEINPVLVHAEGEGVTIVDALAVPAHSLPQNASRTQVA